MRVLTVLTIFLAIATGVGFRYPDHVSAAADAARLELDEFLYQKRVEISGLKRLNERDISARIPLDEPNFIWAVSSDKISDELRKHPLINDAVLTRCKSSAWYQLSCFQLQITERTPRFVAIMGERAWLVGQDGVFIAPLEAEGKPDPILRKAADAIPGAVVVKGLVDQMNSPAYVQAKLELLAGAIDVINASSGRSIEKIVFQHNQEFDAYFRNLPLKVRFEYVAGESDKLRVQAERLRTVLVDLGSRSAEIESIDLAFEKLAVVHVKT